MDQGCVAHGLYFGTAGPALAFPLYTGALGWAGIGDVGTDYSLEAVIVMRYK